MYDPELIAEIYMGEEARNFVKSDIGQYIIGRVEQEEKEALEALAKVSPWRRRRITDLQNSLWRIRSLNGWLADLIISGENARKIIGEEDHD